MRHVLLVIVTFFCIVFGKRYPRGFNDSVGTTHWDYANGTVPKDSLNFTKEEDTNLTKYYENSKRVIIVDNRHKFNGTRNSFKNYPKINEFRLRRTMSGDDNLKKIKTGQKKSTGNKKKSDRVALSHRDHSKGNRTQDEKKNSIDVNKKSIDLKVQQETVKDNILKNKNIKVIHHHHHHHMGDKNHDHSKRTTEADRILKLATKRLTNMGTQKDSRRKQTILNKKLKYKRNDENGSNFPKKYSEWLIFPDRDVNSFNDFQNDSGTDEYRRRLMISANRLSGYNRRQNFVNYQNSNFNGEIMKKSTNTNFQNIDRQNPSNFLYRIVGVGSRKGYKKLGPRRPNMRNMQNIKTDIQYGTDFQKRNFESIDANGLRVSNTTGQSLTNYPSLNSSRYPNFGDKVNYENSKLGKQSLNDFAEFKISNARDYMENFERNSPARNSVAEKLENFWKIENGADAKSILENHTKFQTFSFEPGQPNQYPGLQEIYLKDLNSKLLSSPKKERRGILTDDPYYFHREHFENLPTGEVFHQHRLIVENSIVPTKLHAKENLANLYKGVRFFLDRRIKREDYYRLPLEESKKDLTISSKRYSKNLNESKFAKKKISNRDDSLTKNSIKKKNIDELFLNLKDNGHDYLVEEEQVTKAEEQDYSDITSHEDHARSSRGRDIPKTMNTMIFKREIEKNESTPENPSISKLTIPEMTQQILEELNSKKKRLTPKINKKGPRKDEAEEKKESKIGYKRKVSKKSHFKANKNDPSKSKSDDIKVLESSTKSNIPEQDHQAPDFKYDGIKDEYFMMTDNMMTDLNEDHLNKNIVLPIKIKENELMDDFITSKNTALTSMRPIVMKNKEWTKDHLKRKLAARDKMADDDSGLYGSMEGDISTDINLKDYKLKESNHESKSFVPIDDIQFESFHDRKTWDQLDDSEDFMETKNESISMTQSNLKDPKRILNNDQITPYNRNNFIYKPYAMEIGSRSSIKNINNQKSKTQSNLKTFVNTSNIKWGSQDHLDPFDVNFEVHGKQPCNKDNERGIDVCSEEESQEGVEDDEKKKWPISPGPIVCNSDYEVSTTFATKPTEYPFVVSIQYQNLLTKQLSHACNGVIVGTRFIVSAAHCLNNRDNFELVVQRAHDLCDEDVKPVPVALVMEHENYNRHTRMNDLALLRLKYEVDTDQVSTPENDVIYNDFYSVGWGELMWNRFEKNVTKIQQKLPVLRYPDKMKEDPGTIFVTTAGLDITGAFRGDYGGILMNEKREFIGVQSKLYQNEDREVFIRIRTYLPWIENMMNLSKRLLEHPYKFRPKKPRRDTDK